MKTIFFIITLFIICGAALFAQQPQNIRHSIVASEQGWFHGWPANNGIWVWENEILVGFTRVEYATTSGHNIKEDAPQLSWLARSKDGGHSWKFFDPENYVGDSGKKTKLDKAINFKNPGFTMRISSAAYHGNDDPDGALYYSYDRGQTWQGPYALGNIADLKRFEACILTPRTDYLVLGEKECMVFISSRIKDTGMSDDISVIHTRDGGLTFELWSPWVVPCSDPYRAVMPNSVQISEKEFVTAIRRRDPGDRDKCWIDAYGSTDGGKTWQFLSKIGDTGAHNGNPPALTRLNDGRVCAVYGNRTTKQILGRYSSNNGKSWDEIFVIRDNFYTGEKGDMKDLGYPRLVQTANGELLAIYYWASPENNQQHIAASYWTP